MVSDSVRASRRIQGCLRTRGQVVPGGIVLWTEEGAGERKADAGELGEDLMLLGVPHYFTYAGRCQPPWRTSAGQLAELVDDIHLSGSVPKHGILAAAVTVAERHQDEVDAEAGRLAGSDLARYLNVCSMIVRRLTGSSVPGWR